MERIDKPWGYEIIWAKTDQYVGKLLHVKAGEALSLQYHEKKEETLLVIAGKMDLEFFEDGGCPQTKTMGPMDRFHIVPGLRHRMTAIEDTDIIEASTTELDDVVRLEDRYGRVK